MLNIRSNIIQIENDIQDSVMLNEMWHITSDTVCILLYTCQDQVLLVCFCMKHLEHAHLNLSQYNT